MASPGSPHTSRVARQPQYQPSCQAAPIPAELPGSPNTSRVAEAFPLGRCVAYLFGSVGRLREALASPVTRNVCTGGFRSGALASEILRLGESCLTAHSSRMRLGETCTTDFLCACKQVTYQMGPRGWLHICKSPVCCVLSGRRRTARIWLAMTHGYCALGLLCSHRNPRVAVGRNCL